MVMMKNIRSKKGKPPLEKPEEKTLEIEIEELIDREKTKSRIVSKLLNQTIPPTVKSDN
jgi:hypothetical protein